MSGPSTERAQRYIRQVFKKDGKRATQQKEEMVKRADKLLEIRKNVMKRYKGG